MSDPDTPPGGRYRVREVRRGGMGEVYIADVAAEPGAPARETLTVALKTFQRRFFFDAAARLSFVREASTWLRLSGLPHVMPVFAIEQIGDRPYVLMPAVLPGPSGERSLADLVARGPIPIEDILRFAFQLAYGMREAAVRVPGLVHGDLKPDNALLLGGDAFISDFGLVSAVSLGRPDARLEGTWAYRAPELWRGSPAPSVASDVYAFGALLFELLAGTTPFQARDRDGWAKAHQELRAAPPAGFSAGGTAGKIMTLATECLAKNPGSRPADFGAVFERVNRIFEAHDVLAHFMCMTRTLELRHAMSEDRQRVVRSRAANLLLLEEPAQALAELDTLPVEEYDAMLWKDRATALSLLNRDAEALDCFERALAGDLASADRVSCESEYGLSLKRLGRFDEARRLYERLLTTVPDEQVPGVVVNLATVHLEQENGDRAVELLEPFVRRDPDVMQAWANLGQAYTMVGRYGDAVRAHQRALLIAPQEGRIRVMLAAVYMDHLGQLDYAWASLDAAFDSGHESREWAVRMLACAMLTERREEGGALVAGLRDNLGEELCMAIVNEAVDMAQALVERYSSAQRGNTDHSGGNAAGDADGSGDDDYAQDDGDDDDPYDEDAGPSSDGLATGAHESPGLPFVNFRFYDFHDFTLDYYDEPNAPDFLDRFMVELRRAQRDPIFAAGKATLRGAPFYFTRCPECGVHILTNRDAGKHITCRMCEAPWVAEPLDDPELGRIVASVSEALGIEPERGLPMCHVLFVQPPAENDSGIVAEICRRGDLVPVGLEEMLAVHLHHEALRRGFATVADPWSAWELNEPESRPWARSATPAAISAVVRELAFACPGVRTMSVTLPAHAREQMRRGMAEHDAESEAALRDEIRTRGATTGLLLQLAELLMLRNELIQAEQSARAAVAMHEEAGEAWGVLGRVLVRRERFAAARDALERSLQLDPTSRRHMFYLAVCYDRLGDTRRADEVRARAASLGGDVFA